MLQKANSGSNWCLSSEQVGGTECSFVCHVPGPRGISLGYFLPQKGIVSMILSGVGRQGSRVLTVSFPSTAQPLNICMIYEETNPLHSKVRTRTNTNQNGIEANAAGRSGNVRASRKQSKCRMIQEGEGHGPNSSKKMQKARYLWVLRTPQNNKEEGARA